MSCDVEVLFTPAEFRGLNQRDLSRTTCVVFDVLRATSTMVAALAAGARGIIPVSEIEDALAWKRREPTVLLAGEREGLRIGRGLTGGIEFDFGNSPREFTRDRIAGRTIVCTTTNGTRALEASASAREILAGAFLNQSATVRHVLDKSCERLCLVCAGTGEEAALEDTLAAGAMVAELSGKIAGLRLSDSARIAGGAFRHARSHLAETLREARNARRLLGLPELRDDVEFCIQLDAFDLVAARDADGLLRRLA